MKILHSADWHLGKLLENRTRYDEQRHFIDEIVEIIKKENIDMVIIAGDIYDTSNPSATAETMFFDAMVKLTLERTVPIVLISGNHDSPLRLLAGSDMLKEYGVFIAAGQLQDFDMNFGAYHICSDENGAVIIDKNGEKAVIAPLPYVSDKRINEMIHSLGDDGENSLSYSDKVKELMEKLSRGFREDTINVVVAHLFTMDGLESTSERKIQLGGSYAVDVNAFPEKADYIALGHLHKPQTVPGLDKRGFYSGSPIAYSKDESVYAKAVNIVELKKGSDMEIQKLPLSCIKPIEVYKCNSIEEAIEKCKINAGIESYVYIDIKSDRPLLMEEIRTMKSYKADILETRVLIDGQDDEEVLDIEEMTISENFIDFYKKKRGCEPDEETLETFLSIMGEGDTDETFDA